MLIFVSEFADYFLSIFVAYGFWFGWLAVQTWRRRKIYPYRRLTVTLITVIPALIMSLVGAASRTVVGFRSSFDYLSRLNYDATGIGQTLLVVFLPMAVLIWMFGVIISGQYRIWSTINRLLVELVSWSALLYIISSIAVSAVKS